MDWINIISNNDNIIEQILHSKNNTSVSIRLWNDQKNTLIPKNCYMIKDKSSVGEEIGYIEMYTNAPEEIITDIINGDGTEKENEKLQTFLFNNAYNDKIILEIVCESIDFSQ